MRALLWRYGAALYLAGLAVTALGVAAMIFAHGRGFVAGCVVAVVGLGLAGVSHDAAGA
jgi:hypothetical protein